MLFNSKYTESDAVVDYLKLQSVSQWNEDVALQLAAEEGIQMSEEHWEIVRFVRNFYFKFNTSPAVRILVKAMAQKYGEDKSNSVYLFQLFPKGPARQATKIAGLPRSTKCL